MSRKSVYRAGRAHHTPYGPDVDTSVVYWEFKEVEMQALGEEEPGTGETKPRPFSVKMWVIDENGHTIDDGDANEKVPFKERLVKASEPEAANGNGLSASDIRGAVGGEAIPGISSSSHAVSAKEESEPKIVELDDTPAEPATTAPEQAPESAGVTAEISDAIPSEDTATANEPATAEPEPTGTSEAVSAPEEAAATETAPVAQPETQPVETQTTEPAQPEPASQPAAEQAVSTADPVTEPEDVEMGLA